MEIDVQRERVVRMHNDVGGRCMVCVGRLISGVFVRFLHGRWRSRESQKHWRWFDSLAVRVEMLLFFVRLLGMSSFD